MLLRAQMFFVTLPLKNRDPHFLEKVRNLSQICVKDRFHHIWDSNPEQIIKYITDGCDPINDLWQPDHEHATYWWNPWWGSNKAILYVKRWEYPVGEYPSFIILCAAYRDLEIFSKCEINRISLQDASFSYGMHLPEMKETVKRTAIVEGPSDIAKTAGETPLSLVLLQLRFNSGNLQYFTMQSLILSLSLCKATVGKAWLGRYSEWRLWCEKS